MKVKVLQDFYDKTAENKLRNAGVVLEVDEKRASALQGMFLVEVCQESKADPAKKTAAK